MLSHELNYARRVMLGTFLAALVLLLMVAVWAAGQVLLLLFMAVLLALFLRKLARRLRGWLPCSTDFAVVIVGLGLVTGAGLLGWWIAPELSAQAGRLAEQLPASTAQAEALLRDYAWGRTLLDALRSEASVLPVEDILNRVTGLFSTVWGALLSVLFVLFVGVYLAADPDRYVEGLVMLFPPGRRGRVQEIMDAVTDRLWEFILAQIGSMTLVLVLTSLAMWALGMPIFLALGVIAAFMTFIPYVGPTLALAPAALVALTEGWWMVLWVVLAYGVVQFLESYLITPLMQRQVAQLPPAVTIVAQALMGLYAGLLGLLLAAPLTAAGLVVLRMAYVEDVLGDASPEAS